MFNAKSCFLAVGAIGLLGCGAGGGVGSKPPTPAGVVTLRLAGGPGDGLKAFQVQISKVEVEGPSGWINYADTAKTVDLVTLAAGGTETLSVSNGPVLAGSFSRARVSFAGGASATLGDGTQVTVTTPAAVVVETALVFTGTQQGLVVLLDPGRSLQRREGAYVLRPSLQVLESGNLGRIHGRLTAAGQGLAGVVVTAQSFPEFGVPRLLQRVVTTSDGSFALELLPKGVLLHAVSQPLTVTASFDPQASPAITLGAAAVEWQAAFTYRPTLASLEGAFLPPAASDQSGEVHLVGPVQAGSEVKLFSLRTVPTFREAGRESHRIGAIPTGSYVIRGYRSTWRSDGTITSQGQNSTDLGLVSDFATKVDFLW